MIRSIYGFETGGHTSSEMRFFQNFDNLTSICLLCAIVWSNVIGFINAQNEGEDAESLELKSPSEKAYRKNIKEDANLKVDKLIAKYGYPSEVHSVITEDGYILTMHRIAKPNAQPFFLQHGLVDSSAGYVLMGPNISLAYLLADQGYDVWLGNARGNRYSRNHTTLDPDEEKFWNYSWHEIGIYDLPAMIDYVLNTTGYERIHYAGHSQGCTAFFVMCSMRPDYNNKFIMMQAMAPAVYMSDTNDHPYIKALDLYLKSLVGSVATELFAGQLKFLCKVADETERTCMEAIFALVGKNERELDEERFPLVIGHYPAGVSAKQIKHFIQIIKTKRFAPYSYSSTKNAALYNDVKPPKYNLNAVTVPIYIYYSLNDLLVHPDNVEELYKDLQNPIGKYLVPMKEFSHMDFLWASNVRSLLYNHMLTVLKNSTE